jgi:Domain of unknown function (DUF5134)
MLLTVFAIVTLHHLGCAVRASRWCHRLANSGHAVMAGGMLVMTWPAVAGTMVGLQIGVLSAAAVWFGWYAVSRHRGAALVWRWQRGWHPALLAAAMIWLLAVMPDERGESATMAHDGMSMAGTAGPSLAVIVVGLLIACYCLAYPARWFLRADVSVPGSAPGIGVGEGLCDGVMCFAMCVMVVGVL